MSEHSASSAEYSRRDIARLIQGLALDQSVNLAEIARLAGVPADVLELCRDGHVSLAPETQLRVATAVVTLAPEHAPRAQTVYVAAQAALCNSVGDVGLHIEHPVPEAARDALRRHAGQTIDLEDTWRRCEAVIESARTLWRTSNQLAAETQRMLARHRKLTAEDAGFLQHYVGGLARMLRECGAPPERALVLVKREAQPLIAEAPPDDVPTLTERVVRWFIDGYYAA